MFDLQKPQFLLAWGQKGDRPGEFFSPIGLAFNGRDELFVTDLNNARVQKFTSGGRYLGGFDLPLDTPPRKSCIIGGIAVDKDGLIYLSFMVQHKIAVYREDGTLVREWGKRGTGESEFNQPGGIVIMPDGTLFVADQCNHRVQHFTRDGKFWESGEGTVQNRVSLVDRSPPVPALVDRTFWLETAGDVSTRRRESSVAYSGSRRRESLWSPGEPRETSRAGSVRTRWAEGRTASVRSALWWTGATASGSAA
jgi:hypothetical protein